MWSDSWADGGDRPDGYRAEPLEILPILWRYKRMIVIVTVVAAGLAYGLSTLQPTQYTATAEMILADPRNAGVFRDQSRIVIDPQRFVRTQAELATSTPALVKVAELIGGRVSLKDLQGKVTARASRDLDLVTITATDATAAGAKQIADAVGTAYQEVVKEDVQSIADAAVVELESAREDLQTRIGELEVALVSAEGDTASLRAQRDAAVAESIGLSDRAKQISVDASLYGSGVQLFEEAELPGSPSQPRPRRNAALGGVLGLMGIGAYAWWLGERRRVADSRHDAAPVLGAPLLGVVPDLESVGATTKAPTLAEPASMAAEAYHFVASSLEHSFDTQGVKVLLVASANPADGKTVTALNLAVALARGGRKVVLVDADERHRGLTRWSHLEESKGLTDISRGTPVADCLRASTDAPSGLSLKIVPAGSPVDPGSGFFRSSGFRMAMTAICQQGEVVVVDSPPILAVADALAVAGRTDGIVLVVTQGTHIQALEDVRDRLSSVGTPVLGYVFNRAHSRGKKNGYGYGYGYGYGSERNN